MYSIKFENAVGKLQLGLKHFLTCDKNADVSTLMLGPILSEPNEYFKLSFAERAVKRQDESSGLKTLEYCDTRLMLSNAITCEQVFSVLGHLLTDRR